MSLTGLLLFSPWSLIQISHRILTYLPLVKKRNRIGAITNTFRLIIAVETAFNVQHRMKGNTFESDVDDYTHHNGDYVNDATDIYASIEPVDERFKYERRR